MGLRDHLAMVVLVEGDLPTLETLSRSLHEDGFDVLPAATAEEGLAYFETARPEILVVDLGLAEGAGAEMIRRLRDPGTAPDGRVDPDLKVVAVWPFDARPRRFRPDLGADASARKPVGYDELRGMLEGLVREDWTKPITVHDLRIDPALGRTVEVAGRTVDLTRAELSLLRVLARDPARVFSREQLLSEVTGKVLIPPSRAIDLQASLLRKKLDPEGGRWVFPRRGVGYSLVRG